MAFPKGATAEEFADPNFAQMYEEHFLRYIEFRVKGFHPSTAYQRTFAIGQITSGLSDILHAIEGNQWVMEKFKARLTSISIEELWDTKTSVHELLSLVRDIFAKDATRLSAVKELNVMVGITVTDPNGKTVAGRSLADFYKDQEEANKKRALPGEDAGDKAPITH